MRTSKSTHQIFLRLGLVMLTIGALVLTLASYFSIVGVPIFIIGIILILLTRKTVMHKIILIGSYLLAIVLFWISWIKLTTAPPEIFLIPKDYRGKVNIIYKNNCTGEVIKSGDTIIYNIPDDGILLLNGELETGTITHTYYLIDKKGKRTLLPKMDVRDFNEEWTLEKNPNEPPRNKLGVFHWGRVGTNGVILDSTNNITNENEQYYFQEFYISTYNDLSAKYDFKYERQFDSIRDKKIIKLCK